MSECNLKLKSQDVSGPVLGPYTYHTAFISEVKPQLHHLPIEGDLKGYLSGKSTRTFHTPPSYGAGHEKAETSNGCME